MNNNNNEFIQNNGNENEVSRMTTINGENIEIIKCPRCGADMRKDARYCMKCGNLNYNHYENKNMKQQVINAMQTSDFTKLSDTVKDNKIEVKTTKTSISSIICLIVNILLFLPIIGLVIFSYIHESISLVFVILSGILALIYFFIVYGYQRILIKDRLAWWGFFIPIYGQYQFFKLAMGNGWFFLLLFIPFVNLIVLFIAYYKLGEKFNSSGILMALFPFIMIPIVGFSKKEIVAKDNNISLKNYNSTLLDGTKMTKKEKAYRAKKTVLTILGVILFVVLSYFLRDYIIGFIKFMKDQVKYLIDYYG